jgi:hypothetical protein
MNLWTSILLRALLLPPAQNAEASLLCPWHQSTDQKLTEQELTRNMSGIDNLQPSFH